MLFCLTEVEAEEGCPITIPRVSPEQGKTCSEGPACGWRGGQLWGAMPGSKLHPAWCSGCPFSPPVVAGVTREFTVWDKPLATLESSLIQQRITARAGSKPRAPSTAGGREVTVARAGVMTGWEQDQEQGQQDHPRPCSSHNYEWRTLPPI